VKPGAAGIDVEGTLDEVTVSQLMLLALVGATGVEAVVMLMNLQEELDDATGAAEDEEVQAAQTSDEEEELVTMGRTGMMDDEDDELELAEDHGPHVVDEEELVTTTTGATGVTGSAGINDEMEVQAAQVWDEELVTTGRTGMVEDDEDDIEELEFTEDHASHTVDEELEHSGDGVTVVVTVTGAAETWVVTTKVAATGVVVFTEEVHGAHVVSEVELELVVELDELLELDEDEDELELSDEDHWPQVSF
jgi:hypothetical protein